jgi:uncharacterized protein YndB with AHSA1/START domain
VECEIDFRPGGAWRIAHRSPDREIPVFFGEYREIVRPERFVWTFGFEGMPGEPGPETYVFEEHDGKTTLTSTAEFDTIEQRDAVLETGMEEGAAETGIGSTSTCRNSRAPRIRRPAAPYPSSDQVVFAVP